MKTVVTAYLLRANYTASPHTLAMSIACSSLGIKPHYPVQSISHPWAFVPSVSACQCRPLSLEQSLPLLGPLALVPLIIPAPPELGSLYPKQSQPLLGLGLQSLHLLGSGHCHFNYSQLFPHPLGPRPLSCAPHGL